MVDVFTLSSFAYVVFSFFTSFSFFAIGGSLFGYVVIVSLILLISYSLSLSTDNLAFSSSFLLCVSFVYVLSHVKSRFCGRGGSGPKSKVLSARRARSWSGKAASSLFILFRCNATSPTAGKEHRYDLLVLLILRRRLNEDDCDNDSVDNRFLPLELSLLFCILELNFRTSTLSIANSLTLPLIL